jgi:hypothetical protein
MVSRSVIVSTQTNLTRYLDRACDHNLAIQRPLLEVCQRLQD